MRRSLAAGKPLLLVYEFLLTQVFGQHRAYRDPQAAQRNTPAPPRRTAGARAGTAAAARRPVPARFPVGSLHGDITCDPMNPVARVSAPFIAGLPT